MKILFLEIFSIVREEKEAVIVNNILFNEYYFYIVYVANIFVLN